MRRRSFSRRLRAPEAERFKPVLVRETHPKQRPEEAATHTAGRDASGKQPMSVTMRQCGVSRLLAHENQYLSDKEWSL